MKFNDFTAELFNFRNDLYSKNIKLGRINIGEIYIKLIAKKSTEFAAFCSIDKDWWEENLFFIREIFVDPKFQKLGIGKTMIGKCIEHAKDKKAIGIVTETDFKNTPMKNLCEKFNFKKWDNPRWKEGITYKLIF